MRGISKNRIKLLLGTSKPASVLTLLNLGVYGVWLVLYIVCTMIRASLFSQAQSQMAMSGQTQYTVTVSSPLFTALKFILYLLPVFALVWALVIRNEDKKEVICDKKLIIAALAVIICAAFTAFIDIGKLGLIF